MKILVIGNCQARPLAQILTSDGTNTSLDPIILHLAKDTDAEYHLAAMDEADLILAQYTAPTFKPAHLATAQIRDRFAQKCLVWPNIFYAGQQPFLKYITHVGKGRINGPLDIYHDLRLLKEWYLDRTGSYPLGDIATVEEVHTQSLASLATRERDCDVEISDLIEAYQNERRLFFTFNHPTHWLLESLAMRIAKRRELVFTHAERPFKEPLDRIIPPSTLFDLGKDESIFQGLENEPNQFAQPGRTRLRQFDEAQLRKTTFTYYDRQEDALRDHARIRMTPNFL